MSKTSSATPSHPLNAPEFGYGEVAGDAAPTLRVVEAVDGKVSFGVSSVNTVERLKIRSGSSDDCLAWSRNLRSASKQRKPNEFG